MRSEGDRWDPATVLGLENHEHVVVLGNPAFMSWISSAAGHVTSVRRLAELERLRTSGFQFHRVIAGREFDMGREFIVASAAVLKRGGLLAFFPKDDSSAWNFKNAFEFYYPNCVLREHDSLDGRIIECEPVGTSWRFYN
jgi:hypothetical protein